MSKVPHSPGERLSPGRARRARRRAAKTEQMLDAAMAIALEDGLDRLTVARLAERVDAAVGSLYRYFPSKDALLAALQARAIEQLGVELDAATRAAETLLGDLPTHSRALARAVVIGPCYLHVSQRSAQRHRLIDSWVSSRQPVLSSDAAATVNVSLEPIIAEVAGKMQRATDCGALDKGDQRQRAHVLWATIHGLDHFRKRDRIQPDNLKVQALLAQALRALLLGWGAERDRADEALQALMALCDRASTSC